MKYVNIPVLEAYEREFRRLHPNKSFTDAVNKYVEEGLKKEETEIKKGGG